MKFSSDPNFHYEALRTLSSSRYFGGEIGETLSVIDKIVPGDINSWYREWHALARRVLGLIDEDKAKAGKYAPATLRDIYFRVSRYFFTADFFLHENPADPRLRESYDLWREYYIRANAQMAIPGQRLTLKTPHGFEMPLIIYRAAEASASNPRPTLIVGGGFDSNYEELMHAFGFPILERGYNVVLYEGPGQPTLIHTQKVGFIAEWEKAVTPIVDYLFEQSSSDLSFVDTSKLGLIGWSLGGYLCARAAAFEPRLAAVFPIDGVWSFYECCCQILPPGAQEAYEKGDRETFNKLFDHVGVEDKMTTNQRWFRDHIKFSFCKDNGFDAFKIIEKMTLEGIVDQIKMPAFIGEATEDIFFADQPIRTAKAIGDNAFLKKFTRETGGEEHCQTGAFSYVNAEMLEWFAGVIGERK